MTVATFLDAWNGYLASDIGPRLACSEVEALADLIAEMGRPDLAAAWIEHHAENDEPDDQHYRRST
ncbi:hypothetical protein [Nonomuraea sp. GTA35]|uniref:hypothetical protein n=1 Tax=Nonomuraea sp. GTA35 TaxID=1676746 RepID=UPI0035C18474